MALHQVLRQRPGGAGWHQRVNWMKQKDQLRNAGFWLVEMQVFPSCFQYKLFRDAEFTP